MSKFRGGLRIMGIYLWNSAKKVGISTNSLKYCDKWDNIIVYIIVIELYEQLDKN